VTIDKGRAASSSPPKKRAEETLRRIELMQEESLECWYHEHFGHDWRARLVCATEIGKLLQRWEARIAITEYI
jgi:hypothetical protein